MRGKKYDDTILDALASAREAALRADDIRNEEYAAALEDMAQGESAGALIGSLALKYLVQREQLPEVGDSWREFNRKLRLRTMWDYHERFINDIDGRQVFGARQYVTGVADPPLLLASDINPLEDVTQGWTVDYDRDKYETGSWKYPGDYGVDLEIAYVAGVAETSLYKVAARRKAGKAPTSKVSRADKEELAQDDEELVIRLLMAATKALKNEPPYLMELPWTERRGHILYSFAYCNDILWHKLKRLGTKPEDEMQVFDTSI